MFILEMTKAELCKSISAKTGCDVQTVLAVVESLMVEVKESLEKGENVYLRGFGSFIVKQRAEKTARNISKNTTVIVPAHNIPVFKPAKEFVKLVSKLEDGSFIVKQRAEKTARNISKNTTVIVPAHNIPVFKPAKEFVKLVSKLED